MNSNSNPSPLETMASYAIAFLAGAITMAVTSAYGKMRERKATESVKK